MNSQRQIPAQKEFVFLIHGTNAGDESDEGGRWWQRGSAFWSRFAELLGPNFECQPAGQVFHWSGANSETYRRIAAEDLARWLTRFEEEKRPYHLIGHSHGGSVIWLALRKVINKRGSVAYLRSWATIGTPFLHYKSTALSRWWTLPAVASLLCVASSIPLVLSYFRVLGVVVRNPSGWSASVLLLPVMWLLLLVILFTIFARLGNKLYTSVRSKAEDREGIRAYQTVASRYLGIWCGSDEAIGGLASTLAIRDPVVPRLSGRSTEGLPGRITTMFTAPFYGFYNGVVARVSDEFIWDRVTRSLQGSDRAGFELASVTRGPVPSYPGWPGLPEDITTRLIDTANDEAASTLAAVRNVLGLAAESPTGQPGLLTGLKRSLKFRELIHNLYYSDPDVGHILSLHVAHGYSDSTPDSTRDSLSSLRDWMRFGSTTAEPRADAGSVISAGTARPRNVILPGVVSLALVVLLAFAWTVSSVVYTSSVLTHTDEYQIDYITTGDILSRVVGGADITEASLRDWAGSLTRAGLADRVLLAAAELGRQPTTQSGPVQVRFEGQDDTDGHHSEQLLIMATVAHELLNQGEGVKADSILNDALAIVRTNPPSRANDEGFRAIAEEMAHRGRERDAVYVVDRLSGDREDWRAEGLTQIAGGYADAGRVGAALVTLDGITDLEARAQAYGTFIRDRTTTDPAKRRAMDALLRLSPAIPDTRNWRSGTLATVAEELAEHNDIDSALGAARSIPQVSFRAGALTAIAGSLVRRNRIREARALIEEALTAQPDAAVGAAVVLAQIDRKVHGDFGARHRAIQIVERAALSVQEERFFRESAMGAVAVAWAELGDTRRCFEVLAAIPSGFYKFLVFQPFKESIHQLVLVGKADEVTSFLNRVSDPNKRALAIVALALASDEPTRRTLLLEAETWAARIPDEGDASYVRSEIAKAWARMHQYRYAVRLSEQTRPFDRLNVYQEVIDHHLGEPSSAP